MTSFIIKIYKLNIKFYSKFENEKKTIVFFEIRQIL
jgi:hypothetical protein